MEKNPGRYHSAEIVKTAEGRQYHIGLAPGEVAPSILLCGDPARAERVAARFDKVTCERRNREYVTFTGLYRRIPVTVMATGIGPDNTEIAVIELAQCVAQPTMIRIGSSGALREGIELGDLVISTGGVRLENTSLYFVREGYPAVAHVEVVLALLESVTRLKRPIHLGLTATAPGFYGAQGRTVPGFPPRWADLPAELDRMNVLNFEMETSLLFTLASLRGFRAGAVCAIYANRHKNEFIDTETKDRAEGDCIAAGLGAVEVLRKMDARKRQRKKPVWLPSLKV